MKEVVLIVGYPAAGKTTAVETYTKTGFHRINRDTQGGSMDDLFKTFIEATKAHDKIVLDNTFPTKKSRATFIQWAQNQKFKVTVVVMETDIVDAQVNAIHRLLKNFKGKLPTHDEIRNSKDPGVFPPAALFSYRKHYEEPTTSEGIDELIKVPFVRNKYTHKNKGLILDYDDTLRKTKSGNNYPVDPKDVWVNPNMGKILKTYQDNGYILCGVSNQSGVHKGILTDEQAIACFRKTNELLGLGPNGIDFHYCGHQSNPISCYCRKPMPGLGIYLMEKHGLDPNQTTFVGDMTTDKTFALRCGFKFELARDFFGDEYMYAQQFFNRN